MSLDDVAKVTKIQPRILERLEAGKLDGLPAEVFVRGFVRSFARCVGLDEREALQRYAACALGSQDLTPTVRALVEAMADLAPGSATAARATPRKMQAVEVIDLAGPAVLTPPVEPEAPSAPSAASAGPPPPSADAAIEAPIATAGTASIAAAGTASIAAAGTASIAAAGTASIAVAGTASIAAAGTASISAAGTASAEVAAPIATAVEAPAPQVTAPVEPILASEPATAPAELATPPVEAAPPPFSKKKRGRRRRAREAAAAREAAEAATESTESTESTEANDAAGDGAASREPLVVGTPAAASSSAPWRRLVRRVSAPAAPARPSLVIDDADPESAERVQEQRAECADTLAPRRSFLPPILLDHEDRSARQGGLTLAVILLLIAATLTLSYLMRRPSASGDGVTGREAPAQRADLG